MRLILHTAAQWLMWYGASSRKFPKQQRSPSSISQRCAEAAQGRRPCHRESLAHRRCLRIVLTGYWCVQSHREHSQRGSAAESLGPRPSTSKRSFLQSQSNISVGARLVYTTNDEPSSGRFRAAVSCIRRASGLILAFASSGWWGDSANVKNIEHNKIR